MVFPIASIGVSAKHKPGTTTSPPQPDRIDEPLSIRQLEVFTSLVEFGSFTSAARELGLRQPTVSGHMADLEERLGLRLVERRRSGIRITPAGRALLDAATATLASERHVRQAAAELHGLLTGTVTIGASTIPAAYLLPAKLGEFMTEHENVHVRVKTGSSEAALAWLHDSAVDLAIIGTVPQDRTLECVPFERDQLVLICAPDHPLAGTAGVTRDELLRERFVMRARGSGTRAAMIDGLGIRGREDELNSTLEVESTEAVKAAVRAGLGVSFVSELAISDDLGSGTLSTVPVSGFASAREFYLVRRTSRLSSPSARALWSRFE